MVYKSSVNFRICFRLRISVTFFDEIYAWVSLSLYPSSISFRFCWTHTQYFLLSSRFYLTLSCSHQHRIIASTPHTHTHPWNVSVENTIGKIPKTQKNPHKFSPRFLFLFSLDFFLRLCYEKKREEPTTTTTTNRWNGLNFFSRWKGMRSNLMFKAESDLTECRQNPIRNAQKWCISIWQNENLFFSLSSFTVFSFFFSVWVCEKKTKHILNSYGKINTHIRYIDSFKSNTVSSSYSLVFCWCC